MAHFPSLLSNAGGIEEPQLPGSISPKQSMHKNYIMCWFVYLTVPVSTILSFTCKFLCSFILLHTELPFKNISQVYLQNIPKPINYLLIASVWDTSSWHLDIPPLFYIKVFTTSLSLGYKHFKNPPPKISRQFSVK